MLTRSQVVAAIMTAFAAVAVAEAVAQEPAELRFPVRAFEISGNTLLPVDVAAASVQPFTGSDRSFADIEQARLALQSLYQQAGYGAVQVTVPEQEVTGGVIQFKVIEARLARIDVQEGQHHNRENILAALPELREGRSPNTRDLARSLALANESMVKQTLVTLNTGSQIGEIDAKVAVKDDKPWHGFISAENNGSEESGGDWRLSAGISHGNIFNRDHLVAVQAITSIENPDDVQILGGYWKVPLPELGDAIELSASYASVSGNITAAGGSMGYQAAGYSAGARYVHNLEPFGDYKHNLSAGLDYRLIETETKITPDYSLTPLSIAYGGSLLRPEAQTRFALSYARNLGFANKGSTARLLANGGQDKQYDVARASISHNLNLKGGWDVLLAANGQWTNEPLPGAEDFGVGGAASVRGFEEREIAGETGVRAGVEVTTPVVLKRGNAALRLVGFADFGQVADELAGTDTAVASAGLGARLRIGDTALIKVDAAYVLDGGGVRDEDPGRIHASLVWGF